MKRPAISEWLALGGIVLLWGATLAQDGTTVHTGLGRPLSTPPIIQASAQNHVEAKPAPYRPFPPPPAGPGDRAYPINLVTAMQLAEVEPLDIALAAQRLQVAGAQLQRANTLWLPTILMGGDYFRHDGQLQDVAGAIFGTSKSNMMVGFGPSMIFSFSDALFAPLSARQEMQARNAGVQVAQNDSLLAVAEAYFTVQQARGDLAGAIEAERRGDDLVRRADKLAKELIPPYEANRVRAEMARRRQAVQSARERWRVASAELARLLRLDAMTLVDPLEPPEIQITMVDPKYCVDELIPIALMSRPELAAHQSLVQATLERLRQERLRPLIPSLVIRGGSTNVAGTLGTGYFGGGLNSQVSNFSWRTDVDVQVLWELQNLGFGNRARINERRAENQAAIVELYRTQDRIAAEVAAAHAQTQSAAARVKDAEAGVKDALYSLEKNFEGLNQTRRVGETFLLVIRPQEAVAALQALAQAYLDYYAAIGDFNRAQFRLYRALGNPRWMTPGH
jgi:outer membrane protein TolC